MLNHGYNNSLKMSSHLINVYVPSSSVYYSLDSAVGFGGFLYISDLTFIISK